MAGSLPSRCQGSGARVHNPCAPPGLAGLVPARAHSGAPWVPKPCPGNGPNTALGLRRHVGNRRRALGAQLCMHGLRPEPSARRAPTWAGCAPQAPPGPAGSAPAASLGRLQPAHCTPRPALARRGGPAVQTPGSTPRPSCKCAATWDRHWFLASATRYSVIPWPCALFWGSSPRSAGEAACTGRCCQPPKHRRPSPPRPPWADSLPTCPGCGLSPRGQWQLPTVPKLSPQ